MRKIHRDIVSALLFSEDNKIFMAFRNPSDGGVYLDTWHLPGGGIEDHENKKQALIREVAEETGIDISDVHVELISDEIGGIAEKTLRKTGERVVVAMHFFVFKVQLSKNSDELDVKLGNEFIVYKRFSLTDLFQIKLAPPTIELFKKLHIWTTT